MTDHFKDWYDLKIQLKPFVKMNGAGDKVYGELEEIACYIEGKVELVRSIKGDEVVSTRRVYVDGETAKKFWPYRSKANTAPVAADLLLLDNVEYPILALAPFYRKGKIDLLVVYV